MSGRTTGRAEPDIVALMSDLPPPSSNANPPQKSQLIAGVSLKAAGIVSATILTGFALWALARILEPLALAVFLLIVIDGMARALKKRAPWLPAGLAMPGAVVFIALVFGLTIWLTANNAGDFASRLPDYTARIDALLAMGAQHLGMAVTPTSADLLHKFNPGRYAEPVLKGASHAGEILIFAFIYLGFLLASRQGFTAKAQELFKTSSGKVESIRVFERIRHGVEQYIWVQTVVGVLITALSAALMAAMGLSHIAFWCLIIFLANYIPAIGAAIGVLFPAVFGLVELDGLWRALVLVAGLEAIHFAVSHVVQPRMQGKSMNLDPIVVLLALAFWGVLWGVTGAFLSTPLTVLAMALLAEFEGTRPLAILLSSDGKPYADSGG